MVPMAEISARAVRALTDRHIATEIQTTVNLLRMHRGLIIVLLYPLVIAIYVTRNELASLAQSFYTCMKHQLIHLIIVLFRSIYLGSKVVW